jgi:hypothetical protein
MEEMSQVRHATPPLINQALRRAEAAESMREKPNDLDLNAAKELFAQLMSEAA